MTTVVNFSREKTESQLIERFQEALKILASGSLSEGINIIEEIMNHELVREELDDLRYQCYYNMAVVNEELKNIRQTILYYYKCVSMKENDFNTWLKLANYCMKLHNFEQAEYCFQQCLKYIPSAFYENLIYEKMIYTSFLSKNYDTCLQRLNFLMGKDYKPAELLLVKAVLNRARG